VPIITAVPSASAAPDSVPPVPARPVPVGVTLLPGRPTGPRDESFTIDCADCLHRGTSTCDDCVVSFIVGRQPDDAVVVDADEARAVRLLEHAGLVPGVRHARHASGL
jgi:hypothetical protein